MEGAMPGNSNPSNYPRVEMAINAIAGWITKHCETAATNRELSECSADDLRQITKDLGVSVSELNGFIKRGPGGADLLPKMLMALNLNAQQIARDPSGMIRDLQRICIGCTHKKRCARELARGLAAEHFCEYCPNAFTFSSLVEQEQRVKH
jgi:hypothetical protein